MAGKQVHVINIYIQIHTYIIECSRWYCSRLAKLRFGIGVYVDLGLEVLESTKALLEHGEQDT